VRVHEGIKVALGPFSAPHSARAGPTFTRAVRFGDRLDGGRPGPPVRALNGARCSASALCCHASVGRRPEA
jgi:hypothetical protein